MLNASAPATAQGNARDHAERDAGAGCEAGESAAGGAANASSISSRAPAAESSRRLRSFSRHRRSSLRIEAGVFAGSAAQSGSSFNTAASTWDMDSPAYMSPEQAAGKAVDKRSDLWAFGVVLLEMLTGRQTFAGESISHVLAAVLKDEPDWAALPPNTPASIRKLLRRCLEKDRKRRLDSAAGARLEIDEALTPSSEGATMSSLVVHADLRSGGWLRIAWSIAALFAVLAAALAIAMSLRPALPEAPVFRSTILVNESLSERSPSNRFALSPDGRQLAYVATVATGSLRVSLWTRALDGSSGQELVGTEGATAPFWSPDSRFIAFTVGGKLMKIAATGGTPVNIADAPLEGDGRGTPGTWNSDDVIVLPAPDFASLVRVPAAGGGTPSAVTTLDATTGETHLGFPFFLPDGRHFLFLAYNSLVPVGLYVGSLDSPQRVRLLEDVSNTQYANGSLVFVRGTTLMAQPFDAATLAFTGEAAPIGEQVQRNTTVLRAHAFSVSASGALIYQPGVSGGGASRLMWSDRAGKPATVLNDSAPYRDLSLSPDGTQASVSLFDDKSSGQSDIWIVDVIRGLRTRFTFDPADEYSGVWSPDGIDIVFNSRRKGRLDLYRKAASGSGGEDLVLADVEPRVADGLQPLSWIFR